MRVRLHENEKFIKQKVQKILRIGQITGFYLG